MAEKTAKKQNMYRRCIVNGCQGRHADTSLIMGSFPSNRELRMKWRANLRLPKDAKLLISDRICSRHFEKKFVGRRRLSKDAIPTLKLGYLGKPLYESDGVGVRYASGCCVEGCNANEDVWLFSFPMDKVRRQLWMAACNINLNKGPALYACEKHFNRIVFCTQRSRSRENPLKRSSIERKPRKRCSSLRDTDPIEELIAEVDASSRKNRRLASVEKTSEDDIVENVCRYNAETSEDSESAEDSELSLRESEDAVSDRSSPDEEETEMLARLEAVKLLADTNKALKDILKKLKDKAIIADEEASGAAIRFGKMICSGPDHKFTKADLSLAESINYISPRAYELMRGGLGFRLPDEASLGE